MEDKHKNYSQAIDILRIISILAVVLIHTTTRTFEMTRNDLGSTPWTLFLNQAARFAVPLFFMISGFVLELNHHHYSSYWSYVRRRVERIFAPYVFWSAIYFLFIYKWHPNTSFLTALISGSASHQLYFIPTLLIFYLIFPFLHKLYPYFSNSWSLLALGGIQTGLLYQDYYIHPLPFFYPVDVIFLNFFVFITGTVAAHHQDSIVNFVKKWRYLFAGATLVMSFYITWQGGSNYLQTHNYLAFYSQWRPSVLIYTILLAGILFYLFKKMGADYPVIKKLAGLSFFVFFVHVIVLESIWKFLGSRLSTLTHTHIAQQLWYDPAYFTLTAGISFLIAFLVHKIPRAEKLTG